jgi:galactose oxidase-like protein/Kelch motif protein
MTPLRVSLATIAAGILVTSLASHAARTTGAISPTPSVGTVRSTVPMLEARSGHSATLLPDGTVLIAGGMRRNQDFYRSAEVFDPANNQFHRVGDMSLARVGPVAVLLPSGKVLILGGWVGHDTTDEVEEYDPATQKFAVAGKMTVKRARPSATLLGNGDVLIAGGADTGGAGGVATAELYHPSTRTFETLPSMHDARVAHTATMLNDGRVLIVGGRGSKVNGGAEIYDPQTKRFVSTGNLNVERYKHTAALLPDGRVLVAGGSDSRDWNGTINSAEIYDPRTGKFTATSPLSEPRFKLPDEAAMLSSGLILVAGGGKHAELYDEKTGKFSLAGGDLGDAWHYMTETRLRDGRVLLAGGYANNDRATAQTWMYVP